MPETKVDPKRTETRAEPGHAAAKHTPNDQARHAQAERTVAQRSSGKDDRSDFQKMIDDGWTALAIKAGDTRSSHNVEYDPATYNLEVADERFGAGGEDLEDDDDLPEVRVEEDDKGGWLAIDSTLNHDLTMLYRLAPEIRQ